jgi:hypothetical protein
MLLSAFRVAMAIAQLPMALVMERPMDPDLGVVTGMAGLTDTVAGAVGGMQLGALGGDILLIQSAIHTRLAHHLQCIFSRLWLSPLSWQHKPSPQSGIFAHPPRSIFRM